MTKLTYPEVRRDNEAIDDFHGNKIPNPYLWLEDPDSSETKDFVEKQNELTKSVLETCETRDKFNKRMTKLYDYPKHGCPFRRGNRYFYYHNTGLQNQSPLYVQEKLGGDSKVFLDANAMDLKGLIAISRVSFSEDGELCAYSISKKGSDWNTIKFMKVGDQQELPDVLENVKFSCITWTHDHKGVFYNKYDKDESKQDGTEVNSNLNQKLYYHKLGTEQKEDILVAEAPDHPKWMIHAEISDEGRYVILTASEGCDPVNRLYICDLQKLDYQITGLLPYEKIVDNFDASYEFIANDENIFTFQTNLNAPRYRLIRIDINKPQQEIGKLVAEHELDVLEWCTVVNKNVLVMCYLHDVKHEIYLHRLDSGERYKRIDLDVGAIGGFSGRREHTEMFYTFASFLVPGVIYRYDFKTNEPEVYYETKIEGFDASLYETKQIFFNSKDGTRIPMFIFYKKGITLDGNNPCILYGYGGFNISETPRFSITRTIFVSNYDGIYAVANIRGGGEYGEKWHKDGSLSKKQNCFDDFISAGEYLIQEKYTSKDKLCITGGSNGGLLVTAVANQRPDLFKCVVAHVSVCDMLKFHKFTIGHAWITDFGCADKKEDFEYLIK
ncbi:prolyl endopeptidase-like [Clytia hemisphaerica]|uniref:prolyl endopeptidase-like n=1 Tax=Clytia hemisphaerica TaxID=252671 RepID=UPI0034D3BD40